MKTEPNPIDYSTCRFVVVEDDGLLRDLLASSLRDHFKPAVVEAYGLGRDALRAVRERGADLLVSDLRLPDMDGRDTIAVLKREQPDLKVVVLTGQADINLPAELVALGVAGFVDKAASPDHAKTAIERVLAGGMYFFAGVAPRRSVGAVRLGAKPSMSSMLLTERERDVVKLVSNGMSSKEVANELGLSVRTVENYRAGVMRKLNLRDTVSLVRWSLDQGLV